MTATGSPPLRVLIVDDQELLRAGFRRLLESEDGIEVVGEAADGAEAIAETRRLEPDVVLMDIRMPRIDGIEATRRIAAGNSRAAVLVLTTYDLDEYVFDALQAGASGFLLKDAPPDQLIAGLRMVARGDSMLAPTITRRLIAEFTARRRPPAAGLPELSPRETDVVRLIARGLSNAEIAERLFVGEATVKTHVGAILSKLGCRDRVQVVVRAYESGLVEPGRSEDDVATS
jgi:DNA-binding NarL/FixJ family response regulator